MSGLESIASIQKLLEHPRIKHAQIIELGVCDAVQFRLKRPEPVFTLVEQRLSQRDPSLFKGFEKLRSEIERTRRGAPIKDKIDACCVQNSAWVAYRQIIYSTELEVWMDLAYPNPLALALYQEILKKGKAVHIAKQGPFTDLFHKMLLQKCGYERLIASREEKECLMVFIGKQASLPPDCLHLVVEASTAEQSHPFALNTGLSDQLANGVLLKDREFQLSREVAPDVALFQKVGYRLIGPSLLLLIQALGQFYKPISFTGMGSGFLTTICQNLKHPWPWLPDITSPQSTEIRISIFPETSVITSLFPSREEVCPSLLALGQLDPDHLLFPPLTLFLEASLKGSKAAIMQAAAASFINDYAKVTRGLYQPISADPVIKAWKSALLSPDENFLQAFSTGGVLPDYRKSSLFFRNLRAIKGGGWPTGTYLKSSNLEKFCLRLCAPDRVRRIEKGLGDNSQVNRGL